MLRCLPNVQPGSGQRAIDLRLTKDVKAAAVQKLLPAAQGLLCGGDPSGSVPMGYLLQHS